MYFNVFFSFSFIIIYHSVGIFSKKSTVWVRKLQFMMTLLSVQCNYSRRKELLQIKSNSCPFVVKCHNMPLFNYQSVQRHKSPMQTLAFRSSSILEFSAKILYEKTYLTVRLQVRRAIYFFQNVLAISTF